MSNECPINGRAPGWADAHESGLTSVVGHYLAAATSLYDTEHLKHTLESLVDFDRPNAGMTRFSAGAVNVRTGNLVYFDTNTHTIAPEHVMVSGRCHLPFPRSMASITGTAALCPTRHCSGVIESNLDWSSVFGSVQLPRRR